MGPRRSLTAIVVAAMIVAFASAGACCAHGVDNSRASVADGRDVSGHEAHGAKLGDHTSNDRDLIIRIQAMKQACMSMCGLVPAAIALRTLVETQACAPPLSQLSARAQNAAPATPPPRPG
ncbi:hypothetical protein [Methylopila sp. M107]|uniref:hypothetical protein n=1 Tax=Methylopila sp. M107 TaxID=1101190 RepID=UPI0003800FB5|nr:hypothetical protein [Methylopila sp. M107]